MTEANLLSNGYFNPSPSAVSYLHQDMALTHSTSCTVMVQTELRDQYVVMVQTKLRDMYVVMVQTELRDLCIVINRIKRTICSYGDRLCGLVVRVSGYRYRGPGFDPRRYQIF